MIGPTLIVHGTDEQKQRAPAANHQRRGGLVPGLQRAGRRLDLASLQTRAVRDGDDYVINGQKIWTTGAHLADWMLPARADRPGRAEAQGHLVPPGRHEVAGHHRAAAHEHGGSHEFNEVFFEDVRVPARNLVGEENHGWYVGMTLLDFERSDVGVHRGEPADARAAGELCARTASPAAPMRTCSATGWRTCGSPTKSGRLLSYSDRVDAGVGPGRELRGVGDQGVLRRNWRRASRTSA